MVDPTATTALFRKGKVSAPTAYPAPNNFTSLVDGFLNCILYLQTRKQSGEVPDPF
jgi:hypothetical protein